VAGQLFEMKVVDGAPGVEVRLCGVITEHAKLDGAATQVPEGRAVLLDTGEVVSINSLGVRDWVHFIRALCKRSERVTIRRLSPALVIQANAIYDFLAQARVESFVCPWECTKCGHWHETVHRLEEDPPRSITCPKCSSSMLFWELEEGYLSFREAR
jgi:hypothetical protein